MVDNVAEIKPRSVEEIALELDNQRLRDFALRITDMRKEAETRLRNGFLKIGLAFPLSTAIGIAGSIGSGRAGSFSFPDIGLTLVGFVSASFFLGRAAEDFNASATARGEINSLTTVLASHIIAEQAQQI